MTPKEAITLVETHGIVLESAHGPVPSLAETVAGTPLHGGWWGHPKGDEIFLLSRSIRASREVLVCRLVNGRVTYVHRRLWPALVRLADRFDLDRLAAVRERHTRTGHHEVEDIPFPEWVPDDIRRQAQALSEDEAHAQLSMYVPKHRQPRR